MQEHDRVRAENTTSAHGDPFGKPEMNDGTTDPRDKPLDVVQDVNLTNVLLSYHPLCCGGLCNKASSHHVSHDYLHHAWDKLKNLWMNCSTCYINTYCLNRIFCPPICTMLRCSWILSMSICF